MDENLNSNNIQDAETSAPAQYVYDAPAQNDGQNAVMLRRKIKKGYGWAGIAMIIQFALAMGVIMICSMVYSTVSTTQYMLANPEATQAQLMEHSMSMTTDPKLLITLNTVGYLVANISTFFIAISALKAFKAKSLFGKSELGAGDIALAVAGTLGLQAVSLFVQMLVTSLTGLTGMDPASSEMLGFSEDTVTNIILLVYMVIIAPITEELLCRGFVLNALAPVSRKFAIIASALLFGLMHANFNQMFNGFLLGILLGLLAVKSGSIIPSIIAHMILNANAMFASYVFEYKMAESAGAETATTRELIYFAVLLVIGLAALIMFIKRNADVKSTDCVTPEYIYEVEPAEEANLKWKLLIKCPSFWIVAVFYVVYAASMVTSVTV